ncbi:MAG: hypothetical protein K1X29_01630 [Bdellovibrionales bacterium]|nr:hypothetical protein [Bdellovibrionales bacterium]
MLKWNPTGGLFYHWLAFKYSHRLWEHHKETISLWLNSWQPSSSHLVLVGPSGGYSLPNKFLKKFENISALEIDPLAPWFFQLNHKNLNTKFYNENFFVSSSKKFNINAIADIKNKFPGAAILFCNLLGQLPLLTKDFSCKQTEWTKKISEDLKGVDWASFHDIWSGKNIPHSNSIRKVPSDSSLNESIHFFFNNDKKTLKEFRPNRNPSIITDHGTADLFLKHTHRIQWLWKLDLTHSHCIEAVHYSQSHQLSPQDLKVFTL